MNRGLLEASRRVMRRAQRVWWYFGVDGFESLDALLELGGRYVLIQRHVPYISS